MNKKLTNISLASLGVLGMTGFLVLSGIASPPHIFAAPNQRAVTARTSSKAAETSKTPSLVSSANVQALPPRVLLARGPLKPPAPPEQASTPTAPLHLLHTLNANSALTLSFSPDNQTLASTPMSFELWDVKSGKLKTTLEHDDYPIIGRAVFSPVKPLAAVLLENDRTYQDALVLWDTVSGQIVRTLERPKSSQASWRGFAFSPDGKQLATVQGDKGTPATLLFWDVETGKVVRNLPKVDDDTDQLAFSSDGKTLAGASADRIQLWNASTGELRRTFAHPGVTSFAFTPDGAMLASISANQKGFGGVIKIWDTESEKPLNTLQPDWYTPKTLVFTPNNNTLIIGGGNYPIEGESDVDGKREYTAASGTIAFYDARDGKLQSSLQMTDKSLVTEVALTPDGKILATGEFGVSSLKKGDSVKLWNVE